jgi:hypothetical protein
MLAVVAKQQVIEAAWRPRHAAAEIGFMLAEDHAATQQ